MAIKKTKTPSKNFISCVPVKLPQSKWVEAASIAIEENPRNMINQEGLAVAAGTLDISKDFLSNPLHIAVITTKYWGQQGVKLSVQFLDSPNAATRNKILSVANIWGTRCNIKFVETSGQGDIRISREKSGYWSYLGTDIRSINPSAATMNLQEFTERTSDYEYKRVVLHEFGHTLGCPHEHMRRKIIELLDVNKTIAYFRRTQGWDQATTISQVLTPIEEKSLLGSLTVDEDSIMCYQLPGECTKSGKPIVGGDTITENDYAFMSKLYPLATIPPVAGKNINLPYSVDELIKLLKQGGHIN